MGDFVKIYGKLTDFDGNGLEDGFVEIKDADFSRYIYGTKTDKFGNYTLEVKKGIYMAMAAVKDYGVSKLEYWGWTLPAFEDMEINMQIDRLEIYAINAFMIQRSLNASSLMIYFRPMSLKRYLLNNDILKTVDIINISPNLVKEDIEVVIDEQVVNILEINRVMEKAIDTNQDIFAYLIQVPIPDIKSENNYMKIHITLKDSETGEKGEGSLFFQIPKTFDVINK